jgi:hypothetical protein
MLAILIVIALFTSSMASANPRPGLRGADTDGDLTKASIEVYHGKKLIYEAETSFRNGTAHAGKNVQAGSIVAIGEKAWQLVKNNEAVVNYEQDWAGAVPQEYENDWTSLYGWEDMKSEEFRFHYKIAGDTVSELKWKYYWSAQGKTADGMGHYVINSGAHIDKLYAQVGQSLQASVTAVAPINYGTPEDPIGGIDITVSFTSASIWNSATTTCTVTTRGDSRYDVKDCEGNDP